MDKVPVVPCMLIFTYNEREVYHTYSFKNVPTLAVLLDRLHTRRHFFNFPVFEYLKGFFYFPPELKLFTETFMWKYNHRIIFVFRDVVSFLSRTRQCAEYVGSKPKIRNRDDFKNIFVIDITSFVMY